MSVKDRNKRIAIFLLLSSAARAADLRELESANAKGQWNDGAEISYEILARDPGAVAARLQGAYALFQKGYSNSALLWLKSMKPRDWKSIPQGEDRFAEIISLFQKKVPLVLLPGSLDEIGLADASPYLHDELRFAKGRRAFERGDTKGTSANLLGIAKGSRYYTQAHYLLGAAAARAKDYRAALGEFTKVFEPSVLDQSTEFWRDLSAQMTTHWGANLRIALDAQSIKDSEKIGELSLLGLARASYATRQFEQALGYYSRISPASSEYPQATLEKIWTMLALNRHEDAQKIAAELSLNDQTFQSLEARTMRALILTDVGRTEEARAEIDSFLNAYRSAESALASYETTQVTSTLPAFLKSDLAADIRLKALQEHQDALQKEINSLRAEDPAVLPVYANLGAKLEPWVMEAKGAIYKLVQEHVARRRSDLGTLYVQSKLIVAEAYLEDREKLRKQFKDLQADPEKQLEHDRKLVSLLQSAVDTVDEILPRVENNKVRIEFRQSELIWELATARGIVAQTTKSKSEQVLSSQYKERSLKIAQKVVATYPEFERRPQAMFFIGYAQMDLGRNAEGVRSLHRYIDAFPRDPHVPDAYRMLADLAFDENRLAEAEALYGKILAFPDSPVVGYAFYKMGWCAYNRKDFAKALLGLEKAVRWATGNATANQLLSLKRESHRDLVSLYAEVGDYRKALDYFGRFFQGDTVPWISDLAAELDRIGQFEKSADLYKTLVALEPASPDNAARQAAVISGQYHLHNWDNVLNETRKLVRDYKPQLENPQPDGSPSSAAEKIVRETTVARQIEFQKHPNPEAAPKVQQQDDLYLTAFERWPSAQEPLYRHALFLLSINQLPEAVEIFRRHWSRFKDTIIEPVREESLRNLVYSMDKAGELAKNGPELLHYAEEYAKAYPKTKYARPIQFLRSTVFFRQGNAEQGIQESQLIFNENPADEIGKRAFKNLRVAYYDLKDWQRAYHWADQESKSPKPGMKIYAQDLQIVRMEALFQWADQAKEPAASADLFMQIAQDPQMERLHQKALYNAFIRYHRAGRETDALEVASRLEKDFPGFEALPEIAGTRAALYQEAGDYAHALPLLQAFVQSPGSGMGADVLLKAKMNLGLIAEALGKNEEALRHYESFLISASDRDSAQAKEARRGIERIRTEGKKESPPSTPGTRWAQWEQLQKALAEFAKKPLPLSGDLPTRVKTGGENLERVARKFADAATASGTPAFYAFESYCTLPFLYDSYARAVLASADQVPDLKESERQELRGELAKVTDPIQLKTRSVADQCLIRSAESLHEGPRYREVLEHWGWRSDPDLRQRAEDVLSQLKKGAPWLEQQNLRASESEILKMHLRHQGTEDSWYALARVRMERGSRALARLTIVDGLILFPSSGKLLNALATLSDDPTLYELAAQKGSASASANLAYFHLRAGRLTQAERALETGEGSDAKKWVQELERK